MKHWYHLYQIFFNSKSSGMLVHTTKMFGTFLLNYKTDSQVNNIKKACHYDPEDIVITILEEWLTGKGRPCTWIETLRDFDLNGLANQIETEI